MFKKILTLALATVSFATLPGCTDNEVAASALIIGAAVICDTGCGPSHSHHHRRHRHHRHGHHHRRGHRWAGEAQAPFVSTDARVIEVANNYDISHYAATYIVRAIVLAQTKDSSGIKDLGLTVSDFKDIMDGDKLEAGKLNALSLRLLMNKQDTEQLVQEMSEDIQVEKAVADL